MGVGSKGVPAPDLSKIGQGNVTTPAGAASVPQFKAAFAKQKPVMAPPPGMVKGPAPLGAGPPPMLANKGFNSMGAGVDVYGDRARPPPMAGSVGAGMAPKDVMPAAPGGLAPNAPKPMMPSSIGMAPPESKPMMPSSIGMNPAPPGVGPLINPGPRPAVAPTPAPAGDPLVGSRYARAAGTQWEDRARQAVAGGAPAGARRG